MIGVILLFVLSAITSEAVDVVFNSFRSSDLIFTGDARVESSVIQLTNTSSEFSIGRAFYPNPFSYKRNSDFASTAFIFSIRPQTNSSPGFGFAYVYSNSTVPSGTLSGQYFGLYSSNATPPTSHAPDPLLAVEFDTGLNLEVNDTSNNHIGINLNSARSLVSHEAGYYNSSTGEFVPVYMRSGQNIQAWIETGGDRTWVNVTIAPVGVPRPSRPLISIPYPNTNYTPTIVFVGFSASTRTYSEEQRILAWSFSDERFARDIDTSNLPDFTRDDPSSTLLPKPSSSSGLSAGLKALIIVMSVLVSSALLVLVYRYWTKKTKDGIEKKEKIQEWELEYWPHRFSYEELSEATDGFCKDNLLGFGGFGKVYRGILQNSMQIAVKCMNHDSNQGLREFMAEISSIGRLQHKNLVHMRGWCNKGHELMLVYDYMPNGSLSSWIFGKSQKHLNWETRRRVLTDVAEALNYLHHGWHDMVLHRDIKSSNILLDANMRGRLGDFGLAKLYQNGKAPTTTRLVGTLGYMAPELVKSRASSASDVYSFGVLVLEVVSGRRPLEQDPILVEWVRELQVQGRLREAVDAKIAGEYEFDDVQMVLNVGLNCCNSDPLFRPTMKDVANMLINAHNSTSQRMLVSSVSVESGFITPPEADVLETTEISVESSLVPRS